MFGSCRRGDQGVDNDGNTFVGFNLDNGPAKIAGIVRRLDDSGAKSSVSW